MVTTGITVTCHYFAATFALLPQLPKPVEGARVQLQRALVFELADDVGLDFGDGRLTVNEVVVEDLLNGNQRVVGSLLEDAVAVARSPSLKSVALSSQRSPMPERATSSLWARPALTLIPGGRYEDIDLVMIRENTEGLYVGFEHYIPIDGDPRTVAIGSGINTRAGSRRIAEFAFDYAVRNRRKKVTIVHKANIMKALTGVFLETAREIGKRYEGQVQMDERIVDACAMQRVLNPWQFDVIVTTNLAPGAILSPPTSPAISSERMSPNRTALVSHHTSS